VPRRLAILILAAVSASLLLRLPAFVAPHTEGDECVYIALSERMGWDFSNYTVAGIPNAALMPGAVYVAPLFLHPPLLPYVLKLGLAAGVNPVASGLLFQLFASLLLYGTMARTATVVPRDPGPRAAAFLLVTACPILLFSGSRLHLDGLMAVFFSCGWLLLVEAMETGSNRLAAGAGLCLAAAMNAKFTSLALLPILPATFAWRRYVRGAPGGGTQFAVAAALTVAFGAPHFIRFLLSYGTLDFRPLLAPMPGSRPNSFLRMTRGISRMRLTANLLAIYPFMPWLFGPNAYSGGVRRGDWAPFAALSALYLFLVLLAGSPPGQLRYFAPVIPFAAFAGAGFAQAAPPGQRGRRYLILAVSTGCMTLSGLYTIAVPQIAAVCSWLGAFPALRPFFWGY
jgi:hypothetical protein